MAKPKILFTCTECGAEAPRWQGQCKDCGAWNTLTESIVSPKLVKARRPTSRTASAAVLPIGDIRLEATPRFESGMAEFDRVLGGGIVAGSVTLLGGDPGIGKSSILLQTMCHLSQQMNALYVTGEESPQQVAMRARRMTLPNDKLLLLAETEVDTVCAVAEREQPKIMVIDSIQTMHKAELASAPGGVAQVRETASQLTRLAKETGTALFLVGHVTKAGEVAGPRVLEHIVDAVVYLEGNSDSRFRTMRTVKNRFGAVNELGVFAMTDRGLKEVKNPSAIFLSRTETPAPGSVVMVAWEGSRPLLVEIQALVDDSPLGNPRRVAVGLDHNRLAMLLAVLHRHGGIAASGQDVFVNVVGGVRVMETSADLALLLATVSSLRDRPLPRDLIAFGEVGLAGEIRPVRSGQERLREAVKHGFKRAIVPASNLTKDGVKGLQLTGVETLAEALDAVR